MGNARKSGDAGSASDTAVLLRESERWFEATFEQSAVGMAHMHRSGRFLRVNRRLCELLGYTRRDFATLTFQDITHPDDLETDLRLARQLIAGEIPHYSMEKRYLTQGGEAVWVNLTVSPVRDAEGRVEYYAILVEDIGSRKAAANRLRREREFNANLIQTAHAAIVVLDTEGRIVRFNRFLEEMTGYTSDEVTERNWIETFIPPRERPRIQQVLDQSLGGVRTQGNINGVLTRDGEERLVEWYDSPLTDESGRQVAVLAIGIDVTEREQAQGRLREADRLAAVGNLAASLAHDMSNILLAMRFFMDALGRSALPPPAQASLAELRECVSCLGDLCNGLRQIVREGAADTPEALDLSAWWRRIAPLLRASHPTCVALRDEIDQATPPVRVRESELTRAVLNLVVNAGEAISLADHRAGEIEVDVRPDQRDPSSVLLTVRDDGPGIPLDLLDRVAEPFFSTKTSGLATGMGLAMVKAFVTEAGGGMTIDSRPGRGAAVTLRLPTADSLVTENQ